MRGVLLLTLLLAAPPAFARTEGRAGPAPAQATAGATAPNQDRSNGDLPVSLDRIRDGLQRPDLLHVEFGDDGRVVFRVEVEGRLPTFQEFIGKDTPLTGPTPWGSMTHRDFLERVTPPQMQSFGAFTPKQLLQVAATQALSGAAISGVFAAVKGVQGAIRDRQVRLAQEEVRQVLAELERRKQEAGQKNPEETAAVETTAGAPPESGRPPDPDEPR